MKSTMTPEELAEVLNIFSSGSCEDEEKVDPTKETTSEELANGDCPEGGKHKVFLGMTGDCWPAFCTKCKCYSKETEAWPDWGED
jgi:hypothetical protein